MRVNRISSTHTHRKTELYTSWFFTHHLHIRSNSFSHGEECNHMWTRLSSACTWKKNMLLWRFLKMQRGRRRHTSTTRTRPLKKKRWLTAVVTVVTMAHPRQVSLWPALSYFNVSCTAPLAKDLLHTERLDRRTYQAWDFRLDMLCLSHLECGVRW